MSGSKAPERVNAEQAASGMNGKTQVEVIHSIPGRVRLRVFGLKDDPEVSSQLRGRLSALESIESVAVNPRSSSVVLHYEPTAQAAFADSLRSVFPSIEDLQPRRRERGEDPATKEVPDFAALISKSFRRANEDVQRATGGVDLSLLIPLVLLVLSIVGFAAGAVKKGKLPLPSWYELLWFAFNTFVILNLTLSQRREFESANEGDPRRTAEQDEK